MSYKEATINLLKDRRCENCAYYTNSILNFVSPACEVDFLARGEIGLRGHTELCEEGTCLRWKKK
jgi:hypothetical protein